MPVNLSFDLFPLISDAAKNEQTRPGTLMLEYFQASITISSNEGTVEVPTQLEECLGLIDLNFDSGAGGDASDNISLLTDGVITTSKVTVNCLSISIGDGAINVRGFLVGRTKATTALLNSPT